VVAEGKVLAVVPARGGSKSIPRKNVRPFDGHPLLAYSIAAGLGAESVTRVIVSTDDPAIGAVAEQYGAEVPFLRPANLAQDDTPDLPVFRHVLEWLWEHEGYRPEIVVQLRPTSPLRPLDCVDRAVRLLLEHPGADSVRGVVPTGQNPYKMWRLGEGGRLRPLLVGEFEEPYNMPRQALPPTYWQTGHVDAIRTPTIIVKGSMSGDAIYPLILDPRYTVDIDTLRDWRRAEWSLHQERLEIVRPGPAPRPMPDNIELVVLDFDGVLTDNRVWVDAEGGEIVAAHRGDGWGLARLREAGIPAVVLSAERNPVVAARCEKLGLPVWQGIEDKGAALHGLIAERGVQASHTVYLGNDVNDLPCFEQVGWACAVADAHPEVLGGADRVLQRPGGRGAVRELCDLILRELEGKRDSYEA
jgi:YrbI family 3-deoxy-D-manno-octulosonate 8-phosphate phosphatase